MTKSFTLKNLKRTIAFLTIGSLALVIANVAASQANAAQAFKYSVALIGDMPYDAKGVTQTPNVIASINASDVTLALFGGDTMSGKGDKCTDEAYPALKTNFFDKFTKPVFYSVGDNEWVDCDRAVKGAYDPLTRLALVRSNFFQKADGTYIKLGAPNSRIAVSHDSKYPEMQFFSFKGITYIFPHVPGSANNSAVATPAFKTYNDLAKDGDDVEYKARDAANVAWINKGFDEAKSVGSAGVIVVLQANMDWEGYARDAAVPNNENTAAFANVKQALLTNTLKFKKPVLLQNGDEHWYQVDMPMNETDGKLIEKDKGSLVENFTRVQTFGSGFNHWVELIIDPRAENLWTFKVHIIKENLDIHKAL
ncbi:unannotated protein [freshwater metagenome]|uniref:Unannotated protein n=1 Tax=freshwater metagenome TaxID=449393 RepID=A0A6J6S6Z6_9ZZZZ|nr:hypothetical protein [Actinomycetota bacterium]MSW26558.1 hypothetical protein [Actinomycetota bacterium]MSW34253.1 hypothetical protein [Actinomycetota bacterium]MSX31736.1 hypothetical protein [Actinomycetota bacterium]MSX51944.1 hypothetical protein [Actinomycetota bacterium]